jgi:hypothetical protein
MAHRLTDIALGAHAWLERQRTSSKTGSNWRTHGTLGPEQQLNIYYGAAGVALFYMNLHARTGRPEFLAIAGAAADAIAANLPKALHTARRHDGTYAKLRLDDQAGMYNGVAGIGVVLAEIAKRTGEKRHAAGARTCIALLAKSAEHTKTGVRWSEVHDIVTGGGGIGLSLLYLGKTDEQARDLAIAAGRHLLTRAIEDGGGLRWEWEENEVLRHPNFAHGAAGAGYFLLDLHEATGDRAFLDAALAGARYLATVTEPNGLICHSLNKTRDIYYLGWCHGPVGTGRFYYRLWKATGEARWLEPMFKGAQAIMGLGVPERRTEGLWNNVGPCCGSAGLGEYFADLYIVARQTGRVDAASYRDFALRMAADLTKRATRDGDGLKWTHAEHRVLPDLLTTQSGYMQGAAGVGTMLAYLDAVLADGATDDALKAAARTRIGLPDNPFLRG